MIVSDRWFLLHVVCRENAIKYFEFDFCTREFICLKCKKRFYASGWTAQEHLVECRRFNTLILGCYYYLTKYLPYKLNYSIRKFIINKVINKTLKWLIDFKLKLLKGQ